MRLIPVPEVAMPIAGGRAFAAGKASQLGAFHGLCPLRTSGLPTRLEYPNLDWPACASMLAGVTQTKAHPITSGNKIMGNLKILMVVAGATLSVAFAQPATAQVNMQYNGQYDGRYNRQYGGQFSGQFSGRYYGRGSSDQTASPNATDRRNDIFDYSVNSGACGELYYPSPGTDYVFHDRQGRRCY
jgi:hypothetical protein